MKDDLPYFPFYVNDFLSSRNTRLMTPEQIGMYVLLLIDQWKEGSIPSDIDTLAQICRVDVHKMAEQWITIGKCFKPVKNDENKLINLRLESERKKIKKLRKERSDAGKKGAKIKQQGRSNGTSKASANLNQTSSMSESDQNLEQNRGDQIRKEPSSSVSPYRENDDEVFSSIDGVAGAPEAGGEILPLLIAHKNDALKPGQKRALSQTASKLVNQLSETIPDLSQKLLVNTFEKTLKKAIKHKAETSKWYKTTWLQELEDNGVRIPAQVS